MIRPGAWLLGVLALVACAAVRPAPVADCPVCPSAPARQCPLPPPPKVQWMPQGCPPQFGACLSGLDSAAVNDYLARCSRGR